jgi:hypothetical protein
MTGLVPEFPTSANSPANQGTYQQFNQAHSLTTPVIDAMGSLLALTESQNWTIADVMTTSERVIRIQMSNLPEDLLESKLR